MRYNRAGGAQNRMIDRETVLNALRCHAGCERGFDCGDCAYIGNGDCLDLLAMDAFAMLKAQPEIVRCKDCKYLIDHYGFMNDGYCKKMREYYNVKFKPEKEWFCADGERAAKS